MNGLHPERLWGREFNARKCTEFALTLALGFQLLPKIEREDEQDHDYDDEMIAPEVLLQGYRLGVFPMAMEDGAIEWFSPQKRGIIPLDRFHLPHGLQRTLRKRIFDLRIDTAFARVIRACAKREETWINGEIIRSYTRLHELGQAHSVEAWQENKLVGGLYGVSLGGAFFGESMFHEATDASKVALHALVEHLRAQRFVLLDTQWLTPHLQQFGAIEISRPQYMHLLGRAVALERSF